MVAARQLVVLSGSLPLKSHWYDTAIYAVIRATNDILFPLLKGKKQISTSLSRNGLRKQATGVTSAYTTAALLLLLLWGTVPCNIIYFCRTTQISRSIIIDTNTSQMSCLLKFRETQLFLALQDCGYLQRCTVHAHLMPYCKPPTARTRPPGSNLC